MCRRRRPAKGAVAAHASGTGAGLGMVVRCATRSTGQCVYASSKRYGDWGAVHQTAPLHANALRPGGCKAVRLSCRSAHGCVRCFCRWRACGRTGFDESPVRDHDRHIRAVRRVVCESRRDHRRFGSEPDRPGGRRLIGKNNAPGDESSRGILYTGPCTRPGPIIKQRANCLNLLVPKGTRTPVAGVRGR